MQQRLRVGVARHSASGLTDNLIAGVIGGNRECGLMLGLIYRHKYVQGPRLSTDSDKGRYADGLVEVAATCCSEGGRVDSFVVVAKLNTERLCAYRYCILDGNDYLPGESVKADILIGAAGYVQVLVLSKCRPERCAVKNALVIT